MTIGSVFTIKLLSRSDGQRLRIVPCLWYLNTSFFKINCTDQPNYDQISCRNLTCAVRPHLGRKYLMVEHKCISITRPFLDFHNRKMCHQEISRIYHLGLFRATLNPHPWIEYNIEAGLPLNGLFFCWSLFPSTLTEMDSNVDHVSFIGVCPHVVVGIAHLLRLDCRLYPRSMPLSKWPTNLITRLDGCIAQNPYTIYWVYMPFLV